MKKLFVILTVTAALTISPGANATTTGFDGAEVTATVYCCSSPLESNRISVPLTEIVGSGIEYHAGSIQPLTGFRIVETNIDIENAAIDLTFLNNDILPSEWYVLRFAGSDLRNIMGVSVDPLSTFTVSQLLINFNANTVAISVAGLHVLPDSKILVDVMFAPIPEPETYAMLLAGLGLLGGVTRRRKNFSK